MQPQKNALAGLNPSALVSQFADWLTCLGVVQRRLPAVFRKVELVHIKKSISRPREKRLFQKRHLHDLLGRPLRPLSSDHDHTSVPGQDEFGDAYYICTMEGQRHHNVRYVLLPARRLCLTLQCNNLGVGNKTYL